MKKLLAMAALAITTTSYAEVYECVIHGTTKAEAEEYAAYIDTHYGRDSLLTRTAQIATMKGYMQNGFCTIYSVSVVKNVNHFFMECSVPFPKNFGVCVELKEGWTDENHNN